MLQCNQPGWPCLASPYPTILSTPGGGGQHIWPQEAEGMGALHHSDSTQGCTVVKGLIKMPKLVLNEVSRQCLGGKPGSEPTTEFASRQSG